MSNLSTMRAATWQINRGFGSTFDLTFRFHSEAAWRTATEEWIAFTRDDDAQTERIIAALQGLIDQVQKLTAVPQFGTSAIADPRYVAAQKARNENRRALLDDLGVMPNAIAAARYRRLRENWVQVDEWSFSGRLSALDKQVDSRL